MAQETPKKRQSRVYGAKDGKPFTPENQPSPQAKSDGWKRRRAEMLLSKAIAEQLGVDTDDKAPLKKYAKRLVELAQEGNTEAMKQVRSSVEDVVDKVDLTSDGQAISNPLDLLIKKGGKIIIQGE